MVITMKILNIWLKQNSKGEITQIFEVSDNLKHNKLYLGVDMTPKTFDASMDKMVKSILKFYKEMQ